MALSSLTGIPEQLEGISDSQKQQMAKDCIYYTWSKSTSQATSYIQLHACPQMRLQAAICWFSETIRQITKEGMLNGLYASWIEASHKTRSRLGCYIVTILLLYDPEKLCVVFLNGDWELTEKIAENMTIVQTDIPTPEPSQNYIIRRRISADINSSKGSPWAQGELSAKRTEGIRTLQISEHSEIYTRSPPSFSTKMPPPLIMQGMTRGGFSGYRLGFSQASFSSFSLAFFSAFASWSGQEVSFMPQ